MTVFLAGGAIAGSNSIVAGGQVITGHSLFPFNDPSESVVTAGSAVTPMTSSSQADYPYVAGGQVITGHSLFPFSDPSESVVTEGSAVSNMASSGQADYPYIAGGQVITGHSLFPFSDPSEIRMCLLSGMIKQC